MDMQQSGNGTTLIMGLGNALLGDEGFGLHVIRRIKDYRLPDNVKLLEGGVGGFDLLGHLEGVSHLIVIDVMVMDAPPGELRMYRQGPELAEPGKVMLSFHQVGILDLMQMWSLIGIEPETYFLVTRPLKMDVSMELSPPLQIAANRAAEIVKEMAYHGINEPERRTYPCIL
jgi:hydrogenase maturation protease